jgi:hypothetical protein
MNLSLKNYYVGEDLMRMKNRKRAFSLTLIFAMIFSFFAPLGNHITKAAGVITVAQAIANNTGTATVEGYIIGYAKGTNSYQFQGPFTSNTNIAMADSPTETDPKKIIPVELTTNYRIPLGLSSNPTYLGKKVQITGTLTAYFSVPGLKTPTSYSLVKAQPVNATPDSGIVSQGTTVQLSSPTAGSTVYYTTDGSNPTTTSTEYTTPIVISSAMTLKAIATATGLHTSVVSTFTYTILDTTAPDAPIVDPVNNTQTTITGKAEAGSTVTAKVNGDTIGSTTADVTGNFSISMSKQTAGTVISVTATDAANNESTATEVTVSSVVSNVASVTSSVASGPVAAGTKVELSTTTTDATIYYTTNGDNPTEESTEYTSPIEINKNTTIKAFATALELYPSDVSTFDYTVNADITAPVAPTVNPINETHVVIKGTAEARSTVVAKVNDLTIGLAVADSEGQYSINITKQPAGTLIHVTATDAANNESEPTAIVVALQGKGNLDTPSKDQTIKGKFDVSGWFLDGIGVSKIEVLVDGSVVGEATYGVSRPDVQATYPQYNVVHGGFKYSLDSSNLPEGPHYITVKAYNSIGEATTLNSRNFTVTHALPALGHLDSPVQNQMIKGNIEVSGWFLDGNDITKIEVIVDGSVAGQATYGLSRPDVLTTYPQYNNGASGFKYSLNAKSLTEGQHTIVIKAYNSIGESTSLRGRTINVSHALPAKGNLDFPMKDTKVKGTFNVSGWFLDGAGISKIEVMVDGNVVGDATYGLSRPDILSAFPDYNNGNSGFKYSIDSTNLAEGQHTITVKAYNSLNETTSLSERTFNVSHALAAIGNLDNPRKDQSIAGKYNVSGWFLDGANVSKIEVIVDGTVVGEATYGIARKDVLNAYPQYDNANAGFKYELDSTNLSDGAHTIIIKEYNSDGDVTSLSARTFTVSNS